MKMIHWLFYFGITFYIRLNEWKLFVCSVVKENIRILELKDSWKSRNHSDNGASKNPLCGNSYPTSRFSFPSFQPDPGRCWSRRLRGGHPRLDIRVDTDSHLVLLPFSVQRTETYRREQSFDLGDYSSWSERSK